MLHILDTLEGNPTGIPQTKRNKNRSALIVVDRDSYDLDELTLKISDRLTELLEDEIDSVTIDVKKRTW